jgi:hypothetical protein
MPYHPHSHICSTVFGGGFARAKGVSLMSFDNASGIKSQEIIAPPVADTATGVSSEVASQFASCIERYEPRTPIQRVEDMLNKQLEMTPIFPEQYCPQPVGGGDVRGAEEPGRTVPPNEQKETDPPGMFRKQDTSQDLEKREGDYTPPPGQKPLATEEGPSAVAAETTDASEASLGKSMWTAHAAVTQNGRLGGAASVSAVLRESGVRVDELSISGLEDSLRNKGWQRIPLEEAQPGDVVVAWRNRPNDGNTGIIGEDGSVYSNNSATGQWHKENSSEQWQVDGPQGYTYVYVLRAPD